MRLGSLILVTTLFANTVHADHLVSHNAQPASPLGAIDNLVIRSNPNSPKQCGLDVIEIGFTKDQVNDFHVALLRDTYDKSFGPMPPQIRKVYDYNMPADLVFWRKNKPENAEEPNSIIDRTTRKKQIVVKLVWDLAQFLASSVPYFGPAYYVTDELVEAYVRRNQFHRRQATQLLNTIIEEKPEAFQGIADLNEVKNIVGIGEEYTFGGLFVNSKVAEQVWQDNQDARNVKRAQNFNRLNSILSREGLTSRRISADFLVVYYDPTRQYAREFDTLHTDLKELPKISDSNGTELVPIGIYATGQLDQRILTVDFTDPNRIRARKAIKYMVDLGVKAGVSFLPLPFSLLVFSADKGVRFVLNKYGTNILTDIIQSEAELAMILQTGIAQLSPDLIDSAKKQIENNQLNLLIKWDGKPETNRVLNMEQTANFLKYGGRGLCKEVSSLREKEYRSTFLNFWERTGRAMKSLWPFSSREEMISDREQIISERFDLVKAREILEYSRSASVEDIIESLRVIGLAQDSDDAELIGKHMVDPKTEDVELAAVRSAKAHRSPDLFKYLKKLIEKYKSATPEIIRNDSSLSAAFQVIAALDYTEARQPVPSFDAAIRYLKEKNQDPKLIAKLTSARDAYWEQQWQGY
jgi:hypothetical protein